MISVKLNMQRLGGLILGLTLLVLLCQTTEARRVDCTRFVFAPICRGVAAKRGITPLFSQDRDPEPANRLTNMADLGVEELSFPRSEGLVGADDLSDRRLHSERGKSRRDATSTSRDPIHQYLRMRLAELQDELRSRETDPSDGLAADYTDDVLKGRYQKAIRQAREGQI